MLKLNDTVYFKLISKKHTYKLGVNAIPDYVEFEPSESGGNGYSFYELAFVQKWIHLYPNGLVFEVRVPEDAEIKKYSKSNYKASSIHISNGIEISEFVSKYSREDAFIQEDGKYLKYIKNQTPKLCIRAIKDRISALQYVIDQTPEICVEAVKERIVTIKFMDLSGEYLFENKKLEKCRVADGFKFVKNQTPEICTVCVKENPFVLEYIDDQTSELCMMAIKLDPLAVGCVKNQTIEMCKMAVKQSKWSIFYVNYKQLLDELFA